MSTKVKSPLKWVGGKSFSASRIVSLFPEPKSYSTFIDVFGGAAHVLCAKPPYEHKEVYNDLDGNLVNFWIQMLTHADQIAQRLQQLPYARELYYAYYRSLFDGTELAPLERAIRWFYALRGTGTGWMRKSPPGWNNTEGNMIAYRNVIQDFSAIQQRFAHVLIDNRDAIATIKRYGKEKGTFIYADPPYVGAEIYYEVSKHGFDHVGLAQSLNECPCYVAVSYYDHPDLEDLYPASRWRRVTWEQAKSSQVQHRERVDYGQEVLLMNYDFSQQSLWEEGEKIDDTAEVATSIPT